MSPSIMTGRECMLLLILALLASDSIAFSFSSFQKSRRTSLFSASDNDIDITIALTREDGKNAQLKNQLRELLGDAVKLEEFPCIAHADGDDLDRLESTLKDGDWDYVAVTSPEAARVLATAWTNMDTLPSVAVVGKATQAALEKFGIPVDFCPSKATAKTLVGELPAKRDDGATTVLYPASAKAATTLQDGLADRGFVVTRLNTYDTTTATWTDDQKQLAKGMTVACFGSPSAVHGWLQNSDNNRNVLAACIGGTSATACRELEFPESNIFFPEKPGLPGWAQAVEDALQSLTLAHN